VLVEVKVNVVPASPPSASLRARIDDVEYQRSAKEKEDVFESVRGFSWLGCWAQAGLCLARPAPKPRHFRISL
jgi:hypothetical protein